MLNPDTPVASDKAALRKKYEVMRGLKLSLDLTRGKPCTAQLRLSQPMQRITAVYSRDDFDCRNYGHLEGLPEARELCARYLGTHPQYTYVADGSSLNLMHDFILQGLARGLPGWKFPGIKPKILCPVPGYDRHHAIAKMYGVGMIPIPMMEDGPDLAAVAEALKDPSVVAMFCVPKYHNPTGVTFSPAVVRTLATMPAACPGFRLIWDNAYAVHDLIDCRDKLLNITKLVCGTPTEDHPIVFGSFSKVTFAGAGLAFMGMSEWNFKWWRKSLFAQTIGANKLNQLRHVKFLKSITDIRRHMRKHRRILLPKFDAVESTLAREIGGKGIANWNQPIGGYFISFYLKKGSAKRTVELAKGLGVSLTPAGAAYPYGDPDDSHIRIAPTAVDRLADLETATKVLALCAQIAHWEKWPQE